MKKIKNIYQFTCEICGKIFYREFTEYKYNKLKEQNKLPKTCCISCGRKLGANHRDKEKIYKKVSETLLKYFKQNRKENWHKCKVCGKIYDYNDKTNNSTNKFCSQECWQYYKNHSSEFIKNDKEFIEKSRQNGLKSAASQQRRSKNEIYFYELCKSVFANIDNNKPIFNGWDADIILYDYKLAILWNGAWHYKKISKKQSLEQIQNRDKIKYNEIIKKNIYHI